MHISLGADLGVEAVVCDEPHVVDGVVPIHTLVAATWQQLSGRHLAEVGVLDHEEQTQVGHVTLVMLRQSRLTNLNASGRKSHKSQRKVNASQ